MLIEPELLFGLFSAVTALALIGFAILYWKLQRVTRDLVTVRLHLEHTPAEAGESGFSQDLLVARLRQQVREVPVASVTTDRYRYVASLVRNGLDAAQIADILNLGRGEAEQLVSLSLLSAPPRTGAEPGPQAALFAAAGGQAA